MKKISVCTIACGTVFSIQASALEKTTSFAPIILPGFLDISVSGEIALHPKNTVSLSANYNKKTCYGCRDSGSSNGRGIGVAYRRYLESVEENSWYGHLGFGVFDGRSSEGDSGERTARTMLEGTIQVGRRAYLSNIVFYEFGFGGHLRTDDTKAGDYQGYRRSTPVLNLAMGLKF